MSPIAFFLAYSCLLIYIYIFFDSAAGSTANPSQHHTIGFWLFWKEAGPLISMIMWVNVLVALYLWSAFRYYRAAIKHLGFSPFVVFASCVSLLFIFHDHYYKASQFSPSFTILTYPSMVATRLDPTPDAPEPIVRDQGGAVYEPPKQVLAPLPQYTAAARQARVEGVVIVLVSIERDGSLGVVRVAKGLPMGLSEAAVAAVRTWKYEPATLDGETVRVYDYVAVGFR